MDSLRSWPSVHCLNYTNRGTWDSSFRHLMSGFDASLLLSDAVVTIPESVEQLL